MKRRTTLLLLAFSIGILLFHETIFWDFTVDDAFISFRYAKNFTEGKGLVYNTGERVDGATNILWTILCAGIASLKFNIVLGSKIIGVLSSILALIASYLLINSVLQDKRFSILLPLFLSSTTIYSYWAVSGLEVPFYTLWLLLSLLFFIKEENSELKFPYSSLFLILLTLTRPEGFAIFLIFSVFKGMRAMSTVNGKGFLKWVGLYLLIIGIYLLFKKLYYGYYLPNTFYAKVITHSGRGPVNPSNTLVENARLVYHFVKYFTFPLLAICFIPFLYRKPNWKDGLLITIITFIFLYELKVGDEPNMHLFRFSAPIIPLLLLYVSEGMSFLFHASDSKKRMLSKSILLIMVICIMFSLASQTKWAIEYIKNNNLGQLQEMEMARWFRENTPLNSSILTFWGGLVPFYLEDRYVIEYNGILDEYIAHYGKTSEIKNLYIFDEIKPNYIIPDPYRPEFWNEKRFIDNYRKIDFPSNYHVGEGYLFQRITYE